MMTELQYQQIESGIRGYINGCPDALIRDTIHKCVMRWVKDTRSLVSVCGPFMISRDTGIYEVYAPSDGRPLHVVSVSNRFGEISKLCWTEVSIDGILCVKFYDHHEARGGFTAKVEWEPTEETAELPESWFVEHRSAICDLILATLLAQEGKPWAAPALALQFIGEHRKNLANAIFKMKAEGKPGGQLTCFNPDCTFAGAVF